jgi:cellulose synthase/poly-beta-1,6-N-acetylglucosamine synthase-like glycosyltransferase
VDIVRAAAAPPAVSIIIPLFNQGALLGDTLAAVAAQTFSDWEVVVVDDGSTDDSPSIARALVEKYTAKGMRMRLLHKVRLYMCTSFAPHSNPRESELFPPVWDGVHLGCETPAQPRVVSRRVCAIRRTSAGWHNIQLLDARWHPARCAETRGL